jgi:hypothetical protein
MVNETSSLTLQHIEAILRTPLSVGDTTVDGSKAVFINCPYDAKFAPLSDAIFFSIVCAGFIPITANVVGDPSIARPVRILEAVLKSRYSLHDLSRCYGEGDENLARFNMPLELGMAMAWSYVLERASLKHGWNVLVPAGRNLDKLASDLGAYDLKSHNETQLEVVRRVIVWLEPLGGAVANVPTPPQVMSALPVFEEQMQTLVEAYGEDVPWRRRYEAAVKSVPT